MFPHVHVILRGNPSPEKVQLKKRLRVTEKGTKVKKRKKKKKKGVLKPYKNIETNSHAWLVGTAGYS